MKKINKIAGFWIRFSSLLIDLAIFCLFGISISLMCIEKTSVTIYTNKTVDMYLVRDDYTYFLYMFFLIMLIVIFFIFIPLVSNGRTLGMLTCRLKVKFNNDRPIRSIWKIIELGPLLWIIVITLFIGFVWPITINKMVKFLYIKNNIKNIDESFKNEVSNFLKENKWTMLETTFFTIPSTLSPLVLLIQLFFLISIGFRKEKIGLVDKFSNSLVVYSKKFDFVSTEEIKVIEPEKYIKQQIDWRN